MTGMKMKVFLCSRLLLLHDTQSKSVCFPCSAISREPCLSVSLFPWAEQLHGVARWGDRLCRGRSYLSFEGSSGGFALERVCWLPSLPLYEQKALRKHGDM